MGWTRGAPEASEIHVCSLSVLVVKSKRTGWTGHVARVKREERRVRDFGGET